MQLKRVNANPERIFDSIDQVEFDHLKEANCATIGNVLDLTLEQVETNFDLDL